MNEINGGAKGQIVKLYTKTKQIILGCVWMATFGFGFGFEIHWFEIPWFEIHWF